MARRVPPSGPIAFLASPADEAQAALATLSRSYGNAAPDKADFVVALGGDGFMLQMLHRFANTGRPIYGMNCGTVGFLMNEYRVEGLPDRLKAATSNVVHPLWMRVVDRAGVSHGAFAFNEVSLLRQTHQAAHLRILIDGKERLPALICDGVLVSTPAGSTAYNLSVHGPILPINAPLLALTPISAFRPRLWRGALIPDTASVRIEVMEPDRRPVNAVADHTEIVSVTAVEVMQARETSSTLLFDPDHSWDERILTEQFKY